MSEPDKDETIRRLSAALAPFALAAGKGFVLYDAVKTTIDDDIYKPVLLAEPMYAAMYKATSHLSWSNFLTILELLNDNEEFQEFVKEWARD